LAVTVTAAAKGTAISASITTLVKGTMKMMTWMKIKFAVIVGMVVLLAGGIATVALSGDENSREVREILKSVETQYASITSYTGTSIMITGDSQSTNAITIRASMKLARPDLYFSEYGTNKPTVWSDGSGDFWLGGHGQKPVLVKMWDKGMMSMGEAQVDGSFLTIAPLFFGSPWGNFGKLSIFSSSTVQKLPDEKIGDFDCFVLTATSQTPGLTSQDTATNRETLWIGKQDHLIHQVQSIYEWPIIPYPTDDKFIVDILKKSRIQVNSQTIAERKQQIMERNVKLEEQRKTNPVARLSNTTTHEDIVVNESLPRKDFVPAIPAGLKPLVNLKRFPY
jgi:outer membrane lipoprotein-sorting protein